MTLCCDEPIEKAGRSKLTEIEQLAERLEPTLRRAVQEMLREHVERIDLDDLEAAVRTGSIDRVLAVVGEADPVKAAAVRESLQSAVWAGGALAAAGQGPLREARFVFNRLNPALVRWLDEYDLNLIREVNRGTTDAVRAALRTGMIEGRNPIEQARAIKQSVSLTERQANSVRAYRKELETFHLRRSAKRWGLGNERSTRSGLEIMALDEDGRPRDRIFERRLRDQRFDATMTRAIETKKPIAPDKIDAMVKAYQRRFIQHRARNIARTESLRATNVGVQDAWRQAIAEGKFDIDLVRKAWIVSRAENTCPVCLSIPGANPKRGVRLNEAFQVPNRDPVMLPPQHPSCRCTVFIRPYEAIQLEAA